MRSNRLSQYDLPPTIVAAYEKKGLSHLYAWQQECLNIEGVLDGKNLVYCAPTSGGKTLVSEILMFRHTSGPMLFILPFVSVVSEKELSLKEIAGDLFDVKGFYSGSIERVSEPFDIGVCTIEKANMIINYLVEANGLGHLKLVVIDEMHLLGDSNRGYLLEVLVAKLLYIAPEVQIVGMSATLPNVEAVSLWLRAKLFVTDFRPVPLLEYYCKATDPVLVDREGNVVRNLTQTLPKDTNFLAATVKEVTDELHSVLVFCSSKAMCESTCTFLADRLNITVRARERQPWPCPTLSSCIPRGVSYHHAGLTTDERARIERGYRNGSILVLCATSTLAAGVNLPARRVVFNGINVGMTALKPTMYRQMSGRAGRAGQGTLGESVIVAKDRARAMRLMQSEIEPLASCMDKKGLTRLVLEMLCVRPLMGAGDSLVTLANTTFLLALKPVGQLTGNPQEDYPDMFSCVQELLALGLVECQNQCYKPTSIGKAITAAAMDLRQGVEVWKMLHQFRSQPIIFESDLHVCYLVVPMDLNIPIDWEAYREVYRRLNEAERRVCETIGVFEHSVERAAMQHGTKCRKTNRMYTALLIFLMMRDGGTTIGSRFRGLTRGLLQSLQQGTVSFATCLATFCERLHWWHLEALVHGFNGRLQFGSSPKLVSLIQIPGMDKDVAHRLYEDGFINPQKIVQGDIADIVKTLQKTLPVGVNRMVLDEEVAGRLVTAAKETARMQKKEHAVKLREWRSKEKVWQGGAWSSKKERAKQPSQSIPLSGMYVPASRKRAVKRVHISLHAHEKRLSARDGQPPKRARVDTHTAAVSSTAVPQISSTLPRAVSSTAVPRISPTLPRASTAVPHTSHTPPTFPLTSPSLSSNSSAVSAGLRNLGRLQMTQRDRDAVSQHSPAILSDNHATVTPQQRFVPTWPLLGDPMAVRHVATCNLASVVTLGIYVSDADHTLSVCWGNEGCNLPCISALRAWLFSPQHTVVVENARAFWKLCRQHSIPCRAVLVEPALLHLLFDPDAHLSTYSELYTLYKVPPVGNALAIGRAWALLFLMQCLEPRAAQLGVKSVFYELEVPFQPALFQMEMAGLYVLPQWATANKIQYKLSALEDMAIRMLGRRLQFLSMDDCGKALFEELQLPLPPNGFPRKNNGKVRYTLPAEMLLEHEHPLAYAIYEYRRLSNVLCKYRKLESHARLEADRRVRSEFSRTATGRLVSDGGANVLCITNSFDVRDIQRPCLWDEMNSACEAREGPVNSAREGPVMVTNAVNGGFRQGYLLEVLNSTVADEVDGLCLATYWTDRGWPHYSDMPHIPVVRILVGKAELSYPADQVWRLSAPISIGKSTMRINIRDVIASGPGRTFISLDYCQIEIRMMAHFSRDPSLIAALADRHVDIFQAICANWLTKSVGEVTAEERAGTKSLVYGLVYGMGPARLAAKLKVSVEEAVTLILQFEAAYPGVTSWILATQVGSCGSVESLLGWRRNISGGKKGGRQAVNTMCQASATDLIKLAMIRVCDEIRDDKCVLVLQLHDELLFEVEDHCVNFFAKRIAHLMTCGLINVHVPLAVKCRAGKTWGSLVDLVL